LDSPAEIWVVSSKSERLRRILLAGQGMEISIIYFKVKVSLCDLCVDDFF
jgi:hypothetical protein